MSLLSARDLWVAPPAEGPQGRGAARAVLRGFSLELGPGEWLAISGANGCGKSSLLLALAGLWPLQSGELRFEGNRFGPGLPEERRAGLAVILQDPSSQLLQPTVREELTFSALNLGRAPEVVAREVLRWSGRLGLSEDLERDPQTLSAGRQQLVLLAAALVSQPKLLLADEPAAHLDSTTRSALLEAVRQEVTQGLSVVWVTQDPSESSAADRVVSIQLAETAEPIVELVPSEPDGTLLTLRVSAWDGRDGPAVRTSGPVEIRIGKKGVTGIEGPNAAGKSVLLSVAAGIRQLEQVRVTGQCDPAAPAILSSQYPELEIFEERACDEVIYAAVSRGVPRPEALERAALLLERLGLQSALERRTWSLSGGEKRLLSLAGALLAPASLVILDEPTAGLDARRCLALMEVVGERARDAALLVASQDGTWLGALAARRHRLGGPPPIRTASTSKKTD